MSNHKVPPQDLALLGCALSVAPAAVGCAVGILLSDKMTKRTRQVTALTLFSMGVISAMPYVVDYVSKRVNGPTTARGQQRQRRLIRDGALPAEAELYELKAFEEAI